MLRTLSSRIFGTGKDVRLRTIQGDKVSSIREPLSPSRSRSSDAGDGTLSGYVQEYSDSPARGTIMQVPSDATHSLGLAVNDASKVAAVGKLNTLQGVFMPCIMSIYNVLMYLRFPWMVGTVGLSVTMLLFLIGFAIAIATTLSMSAICANGEVGGGGVYFILSRTLGPTMGGAVGFLTYLGAAISGNLSVLGMLDPIFSYFDVDITGSKFGDTLLLGSAILALFTLISLAGTEFFERISIPLFACSIFAVVSGLIGLLVGKKDNVLGDAFTGPSWTTFQENLKMPSNPPLDPETGALSNLASVASSCTHTRR